MRPYEAMVIFDTGADEAAVNGVLDRALEALKAKGGNARPGGALGAADLRLRAPAQARGLLRGHRAHRRAAGGGRHGAGLRAGRRGAPPQGDADSGQGGRADGPRLPPRAAGRADHGQRKRRDPGGQHHPRSRAALHQHRPGHVQLRPGRQPPVAEPPDPGVGGGHLVLRRGVLAGDGRERRREPEPGRAGDRHRPAGAAQLGDPRRGQAVQGGGGGRRDRPEHPLGHRPGDQERAARARRRWPGRGSGGGRAADRQAGRIRRAGEPQGYGYSEEPF